MKKINLFLFLLLFSQYVFGQSLTLNDLGILVDCNMEKADTHLMSKGYDFFESRPDREGCSSVLWAYKRNSANNRSSNFLSKDLCSNGFKYIFYQTSKREIYTSLRTQIKAAGYKFINQRTDKYGDVKYTYSKGKYEITFSAGLSDDNFTNYYISLISK